MIKQRDLIYEQLKPLVGQHPEQKVFDEICKTVGIICKVSPASPAVYESARSLPNVPLTARALWTFAWRLAGNHGQVLRGVPVRPWTGQLDPEWMPFEILSSNYVRIERFGGGHELTVRAMAGSYTGETTTKFFGGGQFWYLTKCLGFTSKGKKPLAYHDQRQLIQLRFAALIVPELTKDKPAFRDYTVQGSELAWNKAILKQRINREPPCPFEFTHACHECPVGYARGSVTCPAAVRPITLVSRHCPVCDQETWCETAQADQPCIECAKKLKKVYS